MTPPAGRSGHFELNCYFSEQVCGLWCVLNHTSDFPAVFALPGVTSKSVAAAQHQRRASSPPRSVFPAVALSAALSQHGRLSFLQLDVCVRRLLGIDQSTVATEVCKPALLNTATQAQMKIYKKRKKLRCIDRPHAKLNCVNWLICSQKKGQKKASVAIHSCLATQDDPTSLPGTNPNF